MNTTMNLPRLAHQLQELSRLLEETKTVSGEISARIDEARSEIDPFARHVFQARHNYRRANDAARKGTRGIRRVVWDTYQQAAKLGFTGSEEDWLLVLRAAGS